MFKTFKGRKCREKMYLIASKWLKQTKSSFQLHRAGDVGESGDLFSSFSKEVSLSSTSFGIRSGFELMLQQIVCDFQEAA